MKTFDIDPHVPRRHQVTFDDKTIELFGYFKEYAETTLSVEDMLRDMPLADRRQTEQTFKQADDELHDLADRVAAVLIRNGLGHVSGKRLLQDDLGYEKYLDITREFFKDIDDTWNDKAKEFEREEQRIRAEANSRITGPGYGIVTSNPLAAFMYKENAESKIRGQKNAAQRFYDEELDKISARLHDEIVAKLERIKSDRYLPRIIPAIDQTCFELYLLAITPFTVPSDKSSDTLSLGGYLMSQDVLRKYYDRALLPDLALDYATQAIEHCPLDLGIYRRLIQNGLMSRDACGLLKKMGCGHLVHDRLIEKVEASKKDAASSSIRECWRLLPVITGTDLAQDSTYENDYWTLMSERVQNAAARMNEILDMIGPDADAYDAFHQKTGLFCCQYSKEEETEEKLREYIGKQIAPETVSGFGDCLEGLDRYGHSESVTKIQDTLGVDSANRDEVNKAVDARIHQKSKDLLQGATQYDKEHPDWGSRFLEIGVSIACVLIVLWICWAVIKLVFTVLSSLFS